MAKALSFIVSHTKQRMLPASFGDGAVRLARKNLRAGHFRQFRPEQRSRSKGSWFPLISRKPQGDLGRNPACKRHAFSRTQPSLTDRPVGPLDARVSPGWFDRALGRRADDIGQAPLRELPPTAKAQYETDRRHGRTGVRSGRRHPRSDHGKGRAHSADSWLQDTPGG